MDLQHHLLSFAELGRRLPELAVPIFNNQTYLSNNWFTVSELVKAIHAWSSNLTFENLTIWTGKYLIPEITSPKDILVITAGNIPLVGFHDFLSVLISGIRFIGKLSSRDDQLLTLLADELVRIEPGFANGIDFHKNSQY